jgi:rRNA maturation endonuclease Nob1
VIGNDLVKANQEPDLKKLSKTDVFCLDKSIELYGEMSWDEVREKSHDYAWRNAAINRQINFEDIIREDGGDDEYIVQRLCL